MMNDTGRVLYQVTDRIARLTINRPEKLNALDRATVLAAGSTRDERDSAPHFRDRRQPHRNSPALA